MRWLWLVFLCFFCGAKFSYSSDPDFNSLLEKKIGNFTKGLTYESEPIFEDIIALESKARSILDGKEENQETPYLIKEFNVLGWKNLEHLLTALCYGKNLLVGDCSYRDRMMRTYQDLSPQEIRARTMAIEEKLLSLFMPEKPNRYKEWIIESSIVFSAEKITRYARAISPYRDTLMNWSTSEKGINERQYAGLLAFCLACPEDQLPEKIIAAVRHADFTKTLPGVAKSRFLATFLCLSPEISELLFKNRKSICSTPLCEEDVMVFSAFEELTFEQAKEAMKVTELDIFKSQNTSIRKKIIKAFKKEAPLEITSRIKALDTYASSILAEEDSRNKGVVKAALKLSPEQIKAIGENAKILFECAEKEGKRQANYRTMILENLKQFNVSQEQIVRRRKGIEEHIFPLFTEKMGEMARINLVRNGLTISAEELPWRIKAIQDQEEVLFSEKLRKKKKDSYWDRFSDYLTLPIENINFVSENASFFYMEGFDKYDIEEMIANIRLLSLDQLQTIVKNGEFFLWKNMWNRRSGVLNNCIPRTPEEIEVRGKAISECAKSLVTPKGVPLDRNQYMRIIRFCLPLPPEEIHARTSTVARHKDIYLSDLYGFSRFEVLGQIFKLTAPELETLAEKVRFYLPKIVKGCTQQRIIRECYIDIQRKKN